MLSQALARACPIGPFVALPDGRCFSNLLDVSDVVHDHQRGSASSDSAFKQKNRSGVFQDLYDALLVTSSHLWLRKCSQRPSFSLLGLLPHSMVILDCGVFFS